jgi:hypothetical protein
MNVARYYHHETARVGGREDDVNENIRKGLDITKASNIASASKAEGKMLPPSRTATSTGSLRSATQAIIKLSERTVAIKQAYLFEFTSQAKHKTRGTKWGTSSSHPARLRREHTEGEFAGRNACCVRC